jgi:alanine racemase
VGVVPIGYGDGYFRSLSGKAVVRIRGMEAPVCGRVSMDQMTVDVTDIPDSAVGDEVEVISCDPAAPNSVENLARLADTIPYEITCHLGHNIRHMLEDQAGSASICSSKATAQSGQMQ